ncbi:MAG: DUF2520 domain-containing protein [Rikenellaceae bacterium]
MDIRLAIVGSGRVAEVLLSQFSKKIPSSNIVIIARNVEKARCLVEKYGVSCYSLDDSIDEVFDFVIISIKDKFIAEISEKVYTFAKGAVVCHTSGCVHIDEISDCITNKGVFYPLQSITDSVNLDFSEVPIFVEAHNDENVNKLLELASLVSNNVSCVSSETREKLHLCAVFANNFTNHIFTLVNEIVEREGVDAAVLQPLIKATFDRIMSSNPKEIQTGPARRADMTTINRHLELLGDDNTKEVYKTITNSILNTYKDEL